MAEVRNQRHGERPRRLPGALTTALTLSSAETEGNAHETPVHGDLRLIVVLWKQSAMAPTIDRISPTSTRIRERHHLSAATPPSSGAPSRAPLEAVYFNYLIAIPGPPPPRQRPSPRRRRPVRHRTHCTQVSLLKTIRSMRARSVWPSLGSQVTTTLVPTVANSHMNAASSGCCR